MNPITNKNQILIRRSITFLKKVWIIGFVAVGATILLGSCIGAKKISLTFMSRFSGYGLNEDGTYRYRINRSGHFWVSEGKWEKLSNRSIVLTSENPGLELFIEEPENNNSQLNLNKGQLLFFLPDSCQLGGLILIDLNINCINTSLANRIGVGDTLKIDDSLISYPIRVHLVAYQPPHYAGQFKLFSNEVFIQKPPEGETLHLNVSFDRDEYGARESPFRYITHNRDTITY